DKFGDFFLNLNILWWSTEKDWARASAALQELNLVTKERFDAAGIEFAFPTSTIHLRQDG
ncbi:MAG: mechanosensitive ion channel family protein, partial [Verrucomicrobiota bacterium]